LVPGVRSFLEHWFTRLPLALASGALPDEIDFVLQLSGLGPFFAVKANTAEVKAPKPDPAVYLLALERLRQVSHISLRREECLVFEDSPAGMEAALAAGMRCIGVATSADHKALQAAELVIQNFLDARLSQFLEPNRD
jgi:beta-phosphoglucomutase-like phosphatase (HAD superfamily)